MRLKSSFRILSSNLRERPLRETYWSIRRSASQVARLAEFSNRAFSKVVIRDVRDFMVGVRPENGDRRDRTRAAVEWILRAQETTGNGGVALGYFPCEGKKAWLPAYPETTGYIITSLIRYAERTHDEIVRQRALEMAHWEIDIQMPNGATQGGPFDPSLPVTPCAFNTGMVLDGLCSAFEAAKDERVAVSARRGCDYLVSDMTEQGYFKTNGQFVKPGLIKTYNCLCAWAMYRLGVLTDDAAYRRRAVQAIEAAIRQQQPNGWFANNCLTRSDAPLLHTIAYTLQGILEVGILSRRDDFVEAVRLGVAPLLARMAPNGFLPGRFYSDWGQASFSSCLTGSAQLAVICYRLYGRTGEAVYRESGDRLVNFLKPLQRLNTGCAAVDGALAGSFPIFGEYMTAGYPNWATKYLLDALMLQEDVSAGVVAVQESELESNGICKTNA